MIRYILVFEKLEELGDEFSELIDKVPEMKEKMYKKNKAHLKHPTVMWAAKSQVTR